MQARPAGERPEPARRVKAPAMLKDKPPLTVPHQARHRGIVVDKVPAPVANVRGAE